MIIFVKGPLADLIASGEKTSTIRPWKTCALEPGRVLLINNRLPVVLTRVEFAAIRELSADQVRADGFASRHALREALAACYPTRTFDDDTRVCVLHFLRPPQ